MLSFPNFTLAPLLPRILRGWREKPQDLLSEAFEFEISVDSKSLVRPGSDFPR